MPVCPPPRETNGPPSTACGGADLPVLQLAAPHFFRLASPVLEVCLLITAYACCWGKRVGGEDR